jgi:hypothetical protein
MEEDRIGPLFKGRHILLTGGEGHWKIRQRLIVNAISVHRDWLHGKSFGGETAENIRCWKNLHVDASEEGKGAARTFGRHVRQPGS